MEQIILNRIGWIKDDCKRLIKEKDAYIKRLKKMQALAKGFDDQNQVTFDVFSKLLAEILEYNQGWGLTEYTDDGERPLKKENQVKLNVSKILSEITKKDLVKKQIATNIIVKGKMAFAKGYYSYVKKDIFAPAIAEIYCENDFDDTKIYTFDEIKQLIADKIIVVKKFVVDEQNINYDANAQYPQDRIVVPTSSTMYSNSPIENRILNSIPQSNILTKSHHLFFDDTYLKNRLMGFYKIYGQEFLNTAFADLTNEVGVCLNHQTESKKQFIKESRAEILKLLFDQKHEIDNLIKAEKKYNFEK